MAGTNKKRAILDYFGDEGFARLFAAARKKYESYGRIGGTVRLSRLRDAERGKLSGLLSRDLKSQGSVTVSLQELDEILQASRFEVDLLSLLELIYGEPIKPKSVKHLEAESAWKDFVSQLKAVTEKQETQIWLDGLSEGQGYGYRTLRDVFEHTQELDANTLGPLYAVIRALDRLPVRKGKMEQLPIFAAMISGDPHFLDRDRLSGRLFYYGMLAYLDTSEKENTDPLPLDEIENIESFRVRKQYKQAGILLDALSSQVLVVEIADKGDTRSYAMTLHAIERLRNRREGCESQALAKDDFINRTLTLKHLFVSENPSICESLARQMTQTEYKSVPLPAILCTSGQPSVAALELLDFFATHDVMIHYSGDFDVKGLEMAISLEERYRDHWQPWGMTSTMVCEVLAHLDDSIGGVEFSEQECRMLENMACRWDSELVDTLLKGKIKVFQEMFVDQLIREYENVIQ